MKAAVRITGFIIAVAVLLAAVWALPVSDWLQAAVEWTRANATLAIPVFILLYVAATVLMVPGSILTLAAGALFGVIKGSIIVSVASIIGATLAFALGRTLARDWVRERVADRPRFRALDAAIDREGFLVVLLTRLSPLIPFNLINYAYGLTGVRPTSYVIASWIGMLPVTVLYVYAGSLATTLSEVFSGEARAGTPGRVLFGLGLVATVAVTVVITRKAGQILRRELEAGE